MRRYFSLFLFLIVVLKTWGQKMPEDYFTEARIEMFQKNDSAAVRDYTYIVEHYPKSKFCSTSYCQMGGIYARWGEEGRAIKSFRAAIFGRDGEQPNKATQISAYDDIANAADRLINIYERMGNYDSALYFLYLYDTGFSKIYGCGMEADAAKSRTVVRYAEINLKANRVRDAEKALLSMNVFAWGKFDDEVCKKLKELFTEYERPAALRSQIETAVDHYFIDTVYRTYDGGQYTTTYCCLNFLGVNVRYPYPATIFDRGSFDDGPQMAELSEKEKIIANLKKSDLYLLIQEL